VDEGAGVSVGSCTVEVEAGACAGDETTLVAEGSASLVGVADGAAGAQAARRDTTMKEARDLGDTGFSFLKLIWDKTTNHLARNYVHQTARSR
jgi:hypothetical protein